MGQCTVCGGRAPMFMSMCDPCIEQSRQHSDPSLPSEIPPASPPTPSAMAHNTSPPARPQNSAGSESACVVLGLLLFLVGAYFLIVNPSEGGAEMLGRDVVNLQRLYFGQTAAICGAVFLAAGLRPRST